MLDSSDNGRPSKRPFPAALSAMLRASDGILDLLPIPTFIVDAQGTILQYNKRAVEIWGRVPSPGQTHEEFSDDRRFFDLDGMPLPRSLLAEVLTTGVPVRDAERLVKNDDGSQVYVSINIDPLRNGKGELVGAVNCFTDITERKRINDALEQSHLRGLEQEQRLAATYEHVAIGISEVAPDGTFLRVNEAICAITGYSREELLSSRLFDKTYAADIDLDREGFRQQVSGELEFYSAEKRFNHKNGRVIWMSVSSSPVRDASGRLLYVVRVVQDITERKAADRRQKLLIDELNHRVKNTLARVQSLAAQTARGVASPEEFRERFEGRLIALSRAHDQLTVHHWENGDLRALIAESVAPYAGTDGARAVLRGEDVELGPRAVLTLAMAFHELTTNAAKYGALASPDGRIEICWQRSAAEGETPAQLRIDWVEKGGPPVIVPQRRGFGSRMIEGSIAAELGGSAKMVFAPDGLRCEIDVPLAAAKSVETEVGG
ncbi:MAG: PAS domain S-box protein [Pseudolabrys sp.]|nr:PAS domain S-box protein [Pseudolabrys sp.]MDP2293938.1 PAS domain S-box protein [Pseudolabrys sp.]